MKTPVNIGLCGFGVVGEGLYQLIRNNKIARTDIQKICIKDRKKKRSIGEKYFTYNSRELIENDSVNLVVELINNADDAYEIVKNALLNGKSVVSGNKKMLAHHLDELMKIQKQEETALLYDASACGSIPVIRNLEEYYDNDLLKSITGILNGSSNYILSEIFLNNTDYDSAVKQAQKLGYAESDPATDVEGYDALYKLIIIATHGFGTYVSPEKIFTYGISALNKWDVFYAKEKGLKIKPVAQVAKTGKGKFTMFVAPKLVKPEEYIYNVEHENNGVVIEGECYDKQFMFGKGAGAFPTASSVLSDITARSYNYKYEYKKKNYFSRMNYVTDVAVEIYLRYENVLDFSYFDFEEISEKYASKSFNYVIGKIKLSNLLEMNGLLRRLNIFIAFTGK
jgi:homoserine dehydrogenase